MPITCPPATATRLRELLPAERATAGHGLRIAVQGGGCAGLTYQIAFDAPHEKDKVFEFGGLRVFVDAKSYFYVNGSEIVYQDTLLGSGFSLKNPNVKGTCGCGVSFTV